MPAPDTDFSGYLATIVDSMVSSNWKALAVALVIGVVWVLRKSRFIPWFSTDRGGAVLALISGIVTVLGGNIATGLETSFSSVFDGIWMGVAAAGGYSVVKKIISPKPETIEDAARVLSK